MRILLFTFLTLTSFSASAISDQDLYDTCLRKGIEKMSKTPYAKICPGELTIEGIEVKSLDNRWWNPSSYIDYQAMLTCKGQKEGVYVSKLVQYASGECI